MSKTITLKGDARSAIKRGIDQLADTVKLTLGPKGRNVIISHENGYIQSTKDGVSVASSIELDDVNENIGAQIVKQVAGNTVSEVGDGTTTATIFAQAIFNEGLKNVTAGANPMELKAGIEEAVKCVVKYIQSNAVPVADNWEMIEHVATVSANGDLATAKIIASTLQSVGLGGLITLEDSKTSETHVKLVKGMELRQGMISRHFANQEDTMECILEDCYILITDKDISAIKDVMPLFSQLFNPKNPNIDKVRPLFIIANDVDGEALGTMVINKQKMNLPVCAIRTPGQNDIKGAVLDDLCALTGAKLISDESGRTFEKMTISDLGKAEKVVITANTTLIVGGMGKQEDIDNRVLKIKGEIERAGNPALKDHHKTRLAKLTGSIGIIYVGGQSEVEIKEKKDRCEDALGATKAALNGGICPGGGVQFIRALECLKDLKMQKADENTGVEIIRKALQAPLRQILLNAGKEDSGIMARVMDSSSDYGYNARTERFENLIATGVIDPCLVLTTCLQNAASVASLLLSTEAIISKSKKDDK